jgi:hypothetical protein
MKFLSAHHLADQKHPGNYVELVEDDEAGHAASAAQPSHMSIATPAAVAAPAEPKGGATATALYDYEAAGEFEVIFCMQLMILTLLQRTMNSAFQMVPKSRTLCVFSPLS